MKLSSFLLFFKYVFAFALALTAMVDDGILLKMLLTEKKETKREQKVLKSTKIRKKRKNYYIICHERDEIELEKKTFPSFLFHKIHFMFLCNLKCFFRSLLELCWT